MALLCRTNQANVDVTYQDVVFDDEHYTDQWNLYESPFRTLSFIWNIYMFTCPTR